MFWGKKEDKQADAWKNDEAMHDPAMDKVSYSAPPSSSGSSSPRQQQQPVRQGNAFALPAHMDDDQKIILQARHGGRRK